eukprot:CAMPEP_0117047292 /NCGR_PEP_ID=MMETSP0472-20121206/32683_1 /TAXON_ID=693140 ORGANISM="Tiarina fusus, Strain LIS" /NCGR_SAMPLE_ID=MMETSP0472 /ASSEMBLY_ACC=CAM_ASM_000603 /LENGTH=480 /DNA_ID=CAMNT_0004759937 /DNA_START=150 /DNA_END=1592 /DNA_ORIENTATION=-
MSASDEFSLRSLEDYSNKLVKANKESDEASQSSVCLAIIGGGSHAISTLASTPGASSMLLEGILAYDRKSFRSYLGISLEDVDAMDDFRYTSRRAAKMASEVALRRAMGFLPGNLRRMVGCIGVGCSSSLVSPPSSASGIGHIVATRADGTQISLDVSLAGKTDGSARTRIEEDAFVSHMVFRSIDLIQKAKPGDIKQEKSETHAGDSILKNDGTIIDANGVKEDVGVAAANRVLEGKEPVVVLLPMYKEGKAVSFRALAFSAIPDGSLVFPGSFNPPHVGHAALARTAVQKANSTSHRHEKRPIFMEISLTNADKPPIDPDTVSERIQSFLELEDMPKNWGLILTRAPLFSEKVKCLQDCVMGSPDRGSPEISFVIGTDTLVRILNPKYYNDDENAMLEAVRSMEGVNFLVGGRLEQKKGSDEPARFVSGAEEIISLPKDVRDKFRIIEEKDFRVDLSSSHIRAEKAKAATLSGQEEKG